MWANWKIHMNANSETQIKYERVPEMQKEEALAMSYSPNKC